MDIVYVDTTPYPIGYKVVFGFCALIAILLIWRMFRKPEPPSWGRHGKRKK